MKSSKVFNNISNELKAEIPKLAKGQIVTFRMLNGTPNPDPDMAEREKNPILYGKMQINTNARIFDKYKNEYVDVGCVDQWKGDYPDRFRLFVPGMGEYSRFQGKFFLTGGVTKDEELYEFLWLSPERKGSPCADGGIEPIFEIIDLKADTKALVTKYDILKKAIDYSKDISVEKATEIMAALNQPTYQDEKILLAKVKEFATTKPDEFISTYESSETPVRALVKEAIDKGVLNHDLATGEVKMGSVKVADVKIEDGSSFVNEFARWLNTAANGKDVLNNIKSRMTKKGQAETTSSK